MNIPHGQCFNPPSDMFLDIFHILHSNINLNKRFLSFSTIPIIRTAKPGPGAYASEKIDLKQSPPEYSFGIRHSKWASDEDMMVTEPNAKSFLNYNLCSDMNMGPLNYFFWINLFLNFDLCSDMSLGHDLCQESRLVRCRIETFQKNIRPWTRLWFYNSFISWVNFTNCSQIFPQYSEI